MGFSYAPSPLVQGQKGAGLYLPLWFLQRVEKLSCLPGSDDRTV